MSLSASITKGLIHIFSSRNHGKPFPTHSPEKCPEYLRMYTPPKPHTNILWEIETEPPFPKSVFSRHTYSSTCQKHTAHAILLAMQRSQNRKPRRVPSATFQKSLVACVLNLDCPVIPLQQNLHREVRFRQRTLDGTQYKPVNRRYLSRIKPSACIVKIRNQIQLHLQPGHMRL